MYNVTYLRDIQVGLHDKEWVQGIRPRSVRVIEEVFHLRERCLPKACAAIFGRELLTVLLLQSKRFRRVGKGSGDPRMQCLYFFQTGGEKLPLRRRPFVHSDAHEDFTQQSENP